jgi:hypothetical protein
MKQPRLATLFAVLLGLLALRWWAPPGAATTGDVVPATTRATAAPSSRAASSTALPAPLTTDWAAGTRDADDGPLRNAFASRLPPVAVAAAATNPRVPPAPRPFIGPPLPSPVAPPPPPPLPPLQVIGSWQDERGASVFVAGPRGVLQGRVGDVLLSDYRVVSITPSQVLVLQLSINQQFPLAVPAGALAPVVAAR